MNSIFVRVNEEDKHLNIHHCYCIGYAGRNKEKTMEHIKELEKIGVPRPSTIPTLYPVRKNNLNQSDAIEVLGNETSGEAEVVLIFGDTENEIYITVGSDHTDRSLEIIDINKSKQVCEKPLAKDVWKLNHVIDHWDHLILSSQVFVDGDWEKYQEARIDEILHVNDILEYLRLQNVPMKNTVIFSGTVPLLDGFKYGTKFRMALIDEKRNEKIDTEYKIIRLDMER